MNLTSFLKFLDPTEADESTRKTRSTPLAWFCLSRLTLDFRMRPCLSTLDIFSATVRFLALPCVLRRANVSQLLWLNACDGIFDGGRLAEDMDTVTVIVKATIHCSLFMFQSFSFHFTCVLILPKRAMPKRNDHISKSKELCTLT